MIETATGYSFPSGHTQTATSTCYSLLDTFKNSKFKYVLIVFPLLMMLSRMYVGVHTPLDVSVSFIVSAIIVFTSMHYLNRNHDKYLPMICYTMALVSILSFIYTYYIIHTGIVEYELASDGIKMIGATLGFAVGALLETKLLNFDIKKRSLIQTCLLVIIGLLGTVALKSGIKLLLPSGIFTDCLRYFLTIFWILYIYPAIFIKLNIKSIAISQWTFFYFIS